MRLVLRLWAWAFRLNRWRSIRFPQCAPAQAMPSEPFPVTILRVICHVLKSSSASVCEATQETHAGFSAGLHQQFFRVRRGIYRAHNLHGA